ncbi:hypothetical protein AN286_09625 [Aliarcobacter cryaerophilus ATCC 43158]|nr:hypothetical protein AN286_09625 [Aliarcobacter cryaerophilus ATCC 43158]
MNISANSITNNAGVLLSKGKATLISNDDFVNKNGGSIKGSDVQIASINGSVINETYSNTNNLKFGINDFTYTNLGKTSSIEATNGNLVIQAKNDITNIGANLSAKDSLLLQTQSGDINLNAIKLEQGYNVYFKGGFDKAKDVQYQTSDINANNILMQSGNNINLEASKLNANNQINLNAQNDVNILALNSEYYRDTQTTTKGFMSKKTQRDMVYKESVNSSELNANDIVINASNNVNLEASKLKAQDNIIVNAKDGDVNIIAKEYREGELHERSKSSFGGMIKNEYKLEKDNLKIKSSEISANNMILDAKTINVEASKLKANSMEITTEILNMISSKESLYENEFSIKGGILTATIENKGKIEEVVIPSTIEVNDKLIFNKKDITDQLETDNLIKTLSSQGNLTVEQINLVKQIANSKEWHDKTTTLSGLGALIITVIVTYFTAGAGAGIAGSLSGAAAAGASATATQLAVQTAIQATIQAVTTQATTSLVTSAITGNKPQLDLEKVVTSAVTTGILSYANSTLGTNALKENMAVSDYVKNASINGIGQGISSEIRGGEFKDGFVTGAIISVVSDGALQMRKYQETNYDYPGKNDENAIGINRTNLTGNKSILGNNELAGAFPELVVKEDGQFYFRPIEGPTGGYVFGDRTLFGVKIDKTGFFGYVLENFAGPHDALSSWNYQNIGGQTSIIKNDFINGTLGSGVLLIPAAPFAAGTFIQDNYQYIQDVRYFLNENKDKKQEAINNAKDNK